MTGEALPGTRSLDNLRRQLAAADELHRHGPRSAEFKKWCRETEIAIERLFGAEGRHASEFTAIRYTTSVYPGTPNSRVEKAFTDGLRKAKQTLESFISEAEEYSVASEGRRLGMQSIPAIYPKGFFGQEHRRIHKASCFVLMPFHEDFDEVFRTLVLTLQSQELNLLCRRADDFRRPNILETILSSIAQAEFIIADLTGLNPNVFYELGIAHCVKDPENVVLLTQSLEFVPFDLRHLRCIVYELAPAGLQTLRTELLATFHEAAKDAFRFRVWEGKRFALGRKLVGRNNNLFELTIECAQLGHGAVKLLLHFTEHAIDQIPGPIESQFLFLSEDQWAVRVANIPWSLHLAEMSERDALLVLERR